MRQRKVLPELETDHLLFRNFRSSDLEELYRLLSNRSVMQYDGTPLIKNRYEAEYYLKNLLNQGNSSGDSSIRWAAEEKRSRALIGTIGFQLWDQNNHHAELGGNMIPARWGKGFSREALSVILPFGFQSMRLNRVSAVVRTTNRPALAVLNKLKFKREGILRDYHHVNGRYEDAYLYSLLKKDYFKKG
ncbi:GNAT family N-acetyltransferase [Pseudalkalibacillus caeni]|uniref:GNAT family N-acetyltransferase n=1 Tax=Exobacillus caeni TaxID=2574798 RepID=UPI001484F7F6|nr:GNAT family protein [Pseudalkalibacillus caeni]